MLVVGPEVVAWVSLRSGNSGSLGTSSGIGWEINKVLVSGVAYTDFNGTNVVASIAVDGGKITKQFLKVIFDYPFRQLKVNRITCVIAEGNHKSIHLCERLGFKYETKLAEAHPTGALLVYRLFKNECKHLG